MNGVIKISNKSKKLLVCEICGITNESYISILSKNNKFGMELCDKHYRQLLHHGVITDPKPQLRNRLESNEYIIYSDYAEIVMYDRQGKEKARTQIDLEDVEKCKLHKWHIGGSRNYITAHVGSNSIYLHRYIFNSEADEIDHKDRCKLNNKKENLRPCCSMDNAANKNITSKNTSGVVGVSWRKDMNMWWARIDRNGKFIHLGHFSDINEAAKVRREAELKYFGEFAPMHND